MKGTGTMSNSKGWMHERKDMKKELRRAAKRKMLRTAMTQLKGFTKKTSEMPPTPPDANRANCPSKV